jgi:hypothetical protein
MSFCFLACKKQNDIYSHKWLLGTWNASMKKCPFTETWSSKDDYFEGKSELKQEGQVVFF